MEVGVLKNVLMSHGLSCNLCCCFVLPTVSPVWQAGPYSSKTSPEAEQKACLHWGAQRLVHSSARLTQRDADLISVLVNCCGSSAKPNTCPYFGVCKVLFSSPSAVPEKRDVSFPGSWNRNQVARIPGPCDFWLAYFSVWTLEICSIRGVELSWKPLGFVTCPLDTLHQVRATWIPWVQVGWSSVCSAQNNCN